MGRNEILKAVWQRAKHGDNRFSAESIEINSFLKTTEDVAKKAGLSERTAQQLKHSVIHSCRELELAPGGCLSHDRGVIDIYAIQVDFAQES